MNTSKYHRDGYGNSRNILTQELMYQHMSSHYSRILNAKPVVDTSKPVTFKPQVKRPTSSAVHRGTRHWKGSDYGNPHQLSAEDEQLLNHIVTSDQYNPSLFSDVKWTRTKVLDRGHVQNLNISGRSALAVKSNSVKGRRSADVVERHRERFEAMAPEFWPRILRTDVESKVKSMRVYHPPRRRTAFEKEEWGSKNFEGEIENVNDRREQDAKEISQASSRDSAYNEGASSIVDSRSATPLETAKRGFCHSATQTTQMEMRQAAKDSNFVRENKEDLEYTKLMYEITNELVEKGHFTDKALSRVIRRHVSAKIHLDQARVTEEVIKLRKLLGITTQEELTTEELNPAPKKVSVISTANDVSITDSWTEPFLRLSRVSNREDSSNEKEGFKSLCLSNDKQASKPEAVADSSLSIHMQTSASCEIVIEQSENNEESSCLSEEDEFEEDEDGRDSDESSYESTIKENLQIQLSESHSESEHSG